MAEIIRGVRKDLDGFSVNRILPNVAKKMVGPFIFLDHMGPANFAPGEGIDVRPHPHIGLATITYLFKGAMVHRDSLGNNVTIEPGDVNWMIAGKGIVHSERESIETKSTAHFLDGMQCWVALPQEYAEIAPSFNHLKKESLPHFLHHGVMARLVAGAAYGMESPIKTYSPMFYLDVLAQKNREIPRPNPGQECLLYVVDGNVIVDDISYRQGDILLLRDEPELLAESHCRCLFLGGEAWSEAPYLYWNFVAFDSERIEQAKRDWQEQRFPAIPGDELETIPLPE